MSEIAVRDGSGTGRDGFPGADGDTRPRVPASLGAGRGRVPSTTSLLPLADWLSDVRRRALTITVTDGVIHVRGRAANDRDHLHVKHHRHALTVAAAGTHPDWWNTVTGRTATHPDVELPGTYHDPACARCGSPAPHLDPQLLPFCDDHWQAP